MEGKKKGENVKQPPDEARRNAYLEQLKDFYMSDPERLHDVKLIHDLLSNDTKRAELWIAVENVLRDRIIDGRGIKIFEKDKQNWQRIASKRNIRWTVGRLDESGKPINSLDHVKTEWKAFQESKNVWWITSLIDGAQTPARILHPKVKRASLVSFNNPATYCGHLSSEYRGKPATGKEQIEGCEEKQAKKGRKVEKTDNPKDESDLGSALAAQIGYGEAEKYAKALDWLIDNSSVRFDDSVNCIWIDQSQSNGRQLDRSAHELIKSQNEKSVFTRGKAKKGKGEVLADTCDLLKALQRFRNGQKAGYREKRFCLLSLLLRQHGRHAILGYYAGTMGLLDENAERYISRTKIFIPAKYMSSNDEAREFCPTLMDILSVTGIKSEKKQRLVWNREVLDVIVAGSPLPADLCSLVLRKTIRDKHLEGSREKRLEYRAMLATAAGCAKHYLTAIAGKEEFGMGLDINIREPGYLAGRLFSLCEIIQKRGRNWGPTLSDKMFSAAINTPRQTLSQLYKNCLCYKIFKEDSDWFSEIFDKVKLNENDSGQGDAFPENGVDSFSFLLGYWHQRSKFTLKGQSDFTDSQIKEEKKGA